MSKKIMKRSLALGALMAFVITGSVWAQDYTGTNTDNISVGTGTFENTGTVNATTSVTVDGGYFINHQGIVNTGTLDYYGNVNENNNKDYPFGGTINATTAIIYRGIAGNCFGRKLDGSLSTPLLTIVDKTNETGLLVLDSDVLKNVNEIKIESKGHKTGLVIAGGNTVVYDSKITLERISGTQDARIEIQKDAEFTVSEIVASGDKVLLQNNDNAKLNVEKITINSGDVNLQSCKVNETGTVSYALNKIDVADGANLRAVAWTSDHPYIDITGNLEIDLGAGSTVDFGGYTNSDWIDTKINVKAESIDVNVKDVDNAGKVYISKNSAIDNGKITVKASGVNNTGNAIADLGKIKDVVVRNDKTDSNYQGGLGTGVNSVQEVAVGVQLTQEASSIFDGAEGTVQADGTAKVENIIKNTNTYGITENNALSLMTWRAEMNDMNKRMGELRNAEGQYGVWARMVRGEAEYESVKNQYNQYQLGYDEKLSTDPSWTIGAAFNYTEGDTSYSTGSAENKNVGFSIYGSKLNDDGSFIDLIAKYARLENDFETTIGNGDYSSNGYSVSAEYGKRFTKENGLWIEPQVELTYGKVGSADYKMGTIDVAQESIESLVGRVGFSLGKNISKGNVYARASYLYDFEGETSVKFTDGDKPRTMEQDLGGGWWEVGVGANINLSKATYIYADVEKTFGGEVDTNWQWNLGVRYSF